MGSLSGEDDQFFDANEDIASVSGSGSDRSEISDFDFGVAKSLQSSFGYEFWIESPNNIHERRNKFLKWMGIRDDQSVTEDVHKGNSSSAEVEVETDRVIDISNAVLESLGCDDGYTSSHSSKSRWSSDARALFDGSMEGNFVCRIRNLDDGTEFIVDEFEKDGVLGRLREVGSNRLLTVEEFEKSLGLSPLVQQVLRRDANDGCNMGVARKQVKKGWLRRLSSAACIIDKRMEADVMICAASYPIAQFRTQTVRVRSYRKRFKELSSLYMGQEIQAHNGSILTMKFSPDGQYLASAGEDSIVRIWLVVETERSDDFASFDFDPSNVYFAMKNISELIPICIEKDKKGKVKGTRKKSDSACVIFPQKVFQIVESPIHEFCGHSGEVLDLSWSRNKYLLSSSVDKTVRLWKVGCDKCLKVFSHNNYVTCVQFNPMDNNCFISGSIDGKVRIWTISGCKVVDWTDIMEIVTAICYRPDGKGVIVGSMTGNCRFYDVSDNNLQPCARICLKGKKKSPSKRITGFQFSPSDLSKVLVTSADSQVRILHGVDVICKFRGMRNSGSQISASFTSDGVHVVSASEDSNVHVWNYVTRDGPVPQSKSDWSWECFFSKNASVAIPWCGMTRGSSILSLISGTSTSSRFSVNSWGSNEERGSRQAELRESSQCELPFSSPEHFSLNPKVFSESLTKGSATWPEEKLPSPSSMVVPTAQCKSQFKFLKTSFCSMQGSPHAWGMVIVTAGWDGRIRSFQNYGLPTRT